MNPDKKIPSDFIEWIDRALDGTITPEQFAQLDHELATNEFACEYYLEFITTYISLVDLEGVLPKPADIANQDTTYQVDISSDSTEKVTYKVREPGPLHFDASMSEVEKKQLIESYARQQLQVFLEREHEYDRANRSDRYVWSIGDIVDKVTDLGLSLFQTSVKVVKVTARYSVVALILLFVGLHLYANRTVGMLVDTRQAKWNTPMDPEGRLRPRLIKLEEGYAKIRLKKGTEVILQAPTAFKLQNTNRMYVDYGWVTAKVPQKATGFTIKSPYSSVVDFGTEFGFLTGHNGQGEVHVFEGVVGLRPQADSRGKSHSRRLTKNQAATLSPTGNIEQMPRSERSQMFVRSLPNSEGFGMPGQRLNLADMIGGGFGLDTGIYGQYIDVATGELLKDRRVRGGAAGHYTPLNSLPFVDGVFVPDANHGPVVLSSTGLTFENCPVTKGRSYETMNNRAVFQAGTRLQTRHMGVLGGIKYGSKLKPSIGMHPNAGITFDLEKIRNYMPEIRISKFHALCGISDTIVDYFDREFDPNQIKVDFWILVDGKTRFCKTAAAAAAQVEQIDITLNQNDRFLTLATTNPNDVLYCWALFAEAALELTSEGNLTGPR